MLTMDQQLSAIAKEIQWLWSDSFGNKKCDHGPDGRVGLIYVEMAGRVVEWF